MKLFGFTLAECLVTLVIIGVIAALILPMATNLRPNGKKMMYLKAYDTLSESVTSIASNSKLYPICREIRDTEIANCTNYPLFNLNKPIDSRFDNNRYSGDQKLCNLLAFAIGAVSENPTCSSSTYTFNAVTFNNDFNNRISFVSGNGMQWMVVPAIESSSSELDDNTYNGVFQTDVYVDVNGSNGPNCIYSNECKNADRFKFIVNANGKIDIADSLGSNYIETRKNLSKGKTKNNIIPGVRVNGTDRTFTYGLCNFVDN